MSKEEQKDITQEQANDSPPPGVFAVILSTIAAAFGVQSSKNHQRDFKKGNLWVFIASGIIFTVAFVIIVAFIVSTVLKQQS